MGKTATEKDVLYGLEYLNQQLCRWPTAKPGSKPAWSLEPGGMKVPVNVADKIALSPYVVTVPTSRYGEARYAWKQSA